MADNLSDGERSCPLCGGNNHHVVGVRDRRGAPLRTVLCEECGHVFTNPVPSQDALAGYYKEEYRQDYKKRVEPKRKHVHRAGLSALERLSKLAPHISSGSRVIDAGAGGGEFVYLLTKRGFSASGIEPHAGYANFARDAYGIDIKAGTLESIDSPAELADVVTMHHVLEHMRDPVIVLERIWSWLNPGGVLVIEVPNLASWAHAPHHRFHKAHLHTFNRTGLEDILVNTGFEKIALTPPGYRGHLNALARKSNASQSRRWRNAAAESSAVLRAHTPLAHVLSGQPLRRLHASVTRPIQEAHRIRKLGNPDSARALLDALYGR